MSNLLLGALFLLNVPMSYAQGQNLMVSLSEREYEKIHSSYSLQKKINPFMPLLERNGDLNEIKAYGHLRVVDVSQKNNTAGHDFENQILQGFAQQQQLITIKIKVKDHQQARQLILDGHADLLMGYSGYLPTSNEYQLQSLSFDRQADQSVSWIMRKQNQQLYRQVSDFLNNNLLSMELPSVYKEDLPLLKKRKLLRVATRPDPENYFLKNGKPTGFEYEMLQHFALSQGLQLDMITATSADEMLHLLKSGQVDLITSQHVTTQMLEGAELSSSIPFNPDSTFFITSHSHYQAHSNKMAEQQVVVAAEINDFDELKQFYVEHQVKRLLKSKATLPADKFLQRVSTGDFDAALVSAYGFIKNYQHHEEIKVLATMDKSPLLRWTTHSHNSQLAQTINKFLRKEYRSKFYNLIAKRYFPETSVKQSGAVNKGEISPYDQLIKKYAKQKSFDWRLIVAQIYQESQFQEQARSNMGARGLMQLLPRTAKEVGVKKIEDPEDSIKGGLRYMNKLRQRFEKSGLSGIENTWFTLAAYNAGFERIRDARNFAITLKLNPDKWFGNVEKAMGQLSRPENLKHTRFGRCNCGQTVVYVQKIRELYHSYVQLTDPALLAGIPSYSALPDQG